VRLRWLLLPAAGLVIWSAAAHPWGWLYGFGVHPYPASSSTPWTYQLLSGFVPALTVLGLVTLIAGAWHHVNCHEDRCWRIGKHKVDGTPWCSRHHEQARTRRQQTDSDLLRDMCEKLDAIAGELRRWRSPSGLPGRDRA
jgi:hypothetical protein